MQERLHDCRPGNKPNTDPPILPQSPNYLGASRDCGHLWQSGCQNLYTGRGLKNAEGTQKRAKTGRTAPFQQCRGRFSRTYSPASQCPCRHQRWTPLAPPERHLRMPRGESSTQGRSEASGCSGREVPLLGEAHQQGPSLPSADTYNLNIPRTLAAISKPSVASLSWLHLYNSQRL